MQGWQVSAYLFTIWKTNPRTLFMYIKNKIDKTVSRMGVKVTEVN